MLVTCRAESIRILRIQATAKAIWLHLLIIQLTRGLLLLELEQLRMKISVNLDFQEQSKMHLYNRLMELLGLLQVVVKALLILRKSCDTKPIYNPSPQMLVLWREKVTKVYSCKVFHHSATKDKAVLNAKKPKAKYNITQLTKYSARQAERILPITWLWMEMRQLTRKITQRLDFSQKRPSIKAMTPLSTDLQEHHKLQRTNQSLLTSSHLFSLNLVKEVVHLTLLPTKLDLKLLSESKSIEWVLYLR